MSVNMHASGAKAETINHSYDDIRSQEAYIELQITKAIFDLANDQLAVANLTQPLGVVIANKPKPLSYVLNPLADLSPEERKKINDPLQKVETVFTNSDEKFLDQHHISDFTHLV
jgi:hypothetical protein